MIISHVNGKDQLTIEQQFKAGYSTTIEKILFSDGTVWDADQMKAEALKGSAGADEIDGISNNDIIRAGEGDDIIRGAGQLYG